MVCKTADENTADVHKTLKAFVMFRHFCKLMSLNTKHTVPSEQYTDFKRSFVRSLAFHPGFLS